MTIAARSAEPTPTSSSVKTEDKAMLRAAAEMTRDLVAPRPAVYWADFLGSALLGYACHSGAFVVRICGWHPGQREATQMAHDSGLDVSHGICPECRAKMLALIK